MMIEKLRDACGHDYTNKLVRMYTDYEKSKTLSGEFQAVRRLYALSTSKIVACRLKSRAHAIIAAMTSSPSFKCAHGQ